MSTFNLPSKIIVPLFSIAAISMVILLGGTVLRIIGFAVAIVLGIMLAVNILNSVNGNN